MQSVVKMSSPTAIEAIHGGMTCSEFARSGRLVKNGRLGSSLDPVPGKMPSSLGRRLGGLQLPAAVAGGPVKDLVQDTPMMPQAPGRTHQRDCHFGVGDVLRFVPAASAHIGRAHP